MSEQNPEKISLFISYSWDDESHKQWVKQLATDLLEAGFDVRLDVWDTEFGDDLPQYMETSVRDSHRVLLVCTEPYVRKADAGVGGVGYEKMTVTGEFVVNLGTRKFVPIIRQGVGDKITPTFLASRKYIDFRNNAEYGARLGELIESLSKTEASTKPSTPLTAPAPVAASAAAIARTDLSAYQKAVQVIPQQDMLSWRKLVQEYKRGFKAEITTWRAEQDSNPPSTKDELVARIDVAAKIAGPIMSLALAGVESGNSAFSDQRAMLDELLEIPNWPQNGRTAIITAPETLAFVFHCLHGAAAIQSGQPELAIKLATTHISRPAGGRFLFLDMRLMGWSESLGQNCIHSWDFILGAFQRWPWLQDVFGDECEYQTSLVAYFMTLSFVEYLDGVHNGILFEPRQTTITVPACFLRLPEGLTKKALRQATNAEPVFTELAEAWQVDRSEIISKWNSWIETIDNWGNTFDRIFYNNNPMQDFLEQIGWVARSASARSRT